MDDRVRTTVDNHVAEVTMVRADKMNAVDIRMFEALTESADTIAADKSVRAVILSGDGENFCAGIDLGVFGNPEFDFGSLMAPLSPSPANLFQRAAYAWRELEVPVIAALRGVVFGAGFQIAMGADLRYATPDTKLSIMESKWGLIPDMSISATVRNILRPDQVKELAWTGRVFTSDEAYAMGLLTAIVDDPHAAARAIAAECAGRSPNAIRGIKKLVNSGWAMSEADALALEARLQSSLMGSNNQMEAVRANLEKHTPDFAGPE